uniref:Single stranded DNA binding protein 4 n=1 Tax=Callorhinchus milii TaxID=7868 RepID=A0A4W3H3Q9_CALMI
KSAQTFLSEIRWEKNITLGEPPGFLHSWWCVFWDLYCAAPDRRDTCDHSSEAKAFHDYVSFIAFVMRSNLPLGRLPNTHPFPPSNRFPPNTPRAHPTHPHPPPTLASLVFNAFLFVAGHPNMGGPMQRVTPPRGMGSMPPQGYGGGMRPPPSSLSGPGMPGINIIFLSSLPFSTQGPPGGAPPGTPIMPSPGDSTNSSENMYTIMNPIGGGGNRPGFPMGPGGEGPMGGMPGMEPHHMNGTLGMSPLPPLFFPQNSPNNMTGINNPPGTPRDDGEMGGNFLNPFQSESYSPSMTMSV